jgi:hypothetical protein
MHHQTQGAHLEYAGVAEYRAAFLNEGARIFA